MKSTSIPRSRSGFTVVELIVAFLLFSAATTGVLIMSKAMTGHQAAAVSAAQRNAYATMQSEIALQGINPAVVGNPLAGAINHNQGGTAGATISLGANTALTVARQELAGFEVGAVTQPAAAQRSLGGSARVDAVNYSVDAAGTEATRGAGIGFAVETAGPAAPSAAIPLYAPTFNITGDLTNAALPLNNIASLPATNPPGTVYRYTTDGSTPTASSPVWDNNPGWTAASFLGKVTLAAFNTDPQYSPSPAVTATFSMQLIVSYSRADGRTDNPYGFTLADLNDPGDAGILLTTNIPGFQVLYTLDGSDPTVDGLAYSGAFAPGQGNFSVDSGNSDLTGTTTGTATLRYVAVSTDPRIVSAPSLTQTLGAVAVPLTPPSFVTDNSQPLTPGTPVVITMNGGSGSPRTEVNNGSPGTGSSNATSFPLN
ncbi:MAG TPA: chitobiase/beta-hexosaminidase C-terminal domain-containing protein [Opitutaceae bacterium]|nr:chitobiase/beta-hexosaminidase C-terminal domain-containing protein [Opitutaceae bacterium]